MPPEGLALAGPPDPGFVPESSLYTAWVIAETVLQEWLAAA
jgi:hypothetical protein